MSQTFRGFLVAVLVPSLVLLGTPAYANDLCASSTESLAAFDRAWRDSFPIVPTTAKLTPWLKNHLGPHTVLEQAAFQRALLVALEKVYAERIRLSDLDLAQKKALLDSLTAAARDLRESLDTGSASGSGSGKNDPPQGGKGGGNEGGAGENRPPNGPRDSDGDDLAKNIEAHLKHVSYRQCVGQTALLLFVSTVVTTGGALIVNWKRYAKTDASWVSVLVTPESWEKAMADPDFRHNITWNAILMTSLGAMTCLSNKNVGRNLITAVAAVSSVTEQYLAKGEVSIRQTLLDSLFIRYVSFWKTTKVLQMSRTHAAAGRPYPKLFEASMQGVSELIGAFGYPMAVNYSKLGWAEAENFLGTFELFKREPIAAPRP